MNNEALPSSPEPDLTSEPRCDEDFFCGQCDDCLANPDPENQPRGTR